MSSLGGIPEHQISAVEELYWVSIAPLWWFCIGTCSLEQVIEKILDLLLHNILRVGDSVNEDFLN